MSQLSVLYVDESVEKYKPVSKYPHKKKLEGMSMEYFHC